MRRKAKAFAVMLFAVLLALRGPVLAQEHPGAAPPGAEHSGDAEKGGHEGHAGGHAEHYHPLDPGALFVQFLGFAILFGILAYYVFPILGDALAKRREGIKKTFDDLERALDEAHRAKKKAEADLQAAERGSIDRLAQATKEGARLREELADEGTSQATKILHKAKIEAAVERAKLVLELRNEVVDLGLRAAEAVIREAMDAETQERLVAAFLDDVEAIPAEKGAA